MRGIFQPHFLQEKIQLLVWHTLLGYWGGVAPQRGYAVVSKRPWWPQGLRCECPGEVDVWEGDFSVLEEQVWAHGRTPIGWPSWMIPVRFVDVVQIYHDHS